jgi:hypothetical protein
MSEAISSLPSATAPIRHASEPDGAPDTHEISFNELWQNQKEGISFSDLLDIVNPLHHIPVVSTVYRMITGDEIGMGARMAGSVLYGGPMGLLGAGVVAAVEEATGDKIEGHLAAIFTDTPETTEQIAATSSDSFEEEDDTNSPGILTSPSEKLSADQISAAPVNAAAAVTTASLSAASPHERSSRADVFSKSQLTMGVAAAPAQLSKMDERKILQFLSDRKEATGQAASNAVSDKKRLSSAILEAQRAQTGLLLANLGATANSTTASTENDKRNGSTKAQPAPAPVTPFFKPHPYMLPRGAPPGLVTKAMEHALERYNTLNAQKAVPASGAAQPAVR